MPLFPTPQPITVTIDLVVADIRIIASARTDTIVDVRPTNAARAADVKAAERTRVEYSNGTLLIKGTRQWFFMGRKESIDVTIELPEGSHVHGEVTVGELRSEGRLGECGFTTVVGDISLEQASSVTLKTETGNISVERAVGHASVTTGSGTIDIHAIDGTAEIKNSNGHTTIGEVSGDLQLNASTGHTSIDRTLASVTVKTAYGNVRIGEVVRGSVLLESAYGKLEVGIPEGTAAWLDVSSQHGKVRNMLRAHDGPRQAEQTAEVRARSAYGDITIQRSTVGIRTRNTKP